MRSARLIAAIANVNRNPDRTPPYRTVDMLPRWKWERLAYEEAQRPAEPDHAAVAGKLLAFVSAHNASLPAEQRPRSR